MRRESAKSFQDLIVWQKAHQLVLEVYRCLQQFSQNRNLRINFSIETSVCISASKYSRRLSEKGL
ncbi:four helix bundle protein [Okeania sp. SIO2C9]|uniref:four helix bundle protein n=1 Tax=Okeania sp. SIO2C9 TaxID=2607791 RepID=UPI00345D6EBA